VEIGLLGPVEARQDGRLILLGGRRQQAVLAVLALNVGRAVSVAALVDAVWGEDPPATVKQQVHTATWALRRALGGAVVTGPDGYRLAVAADRVDVNRFEAGVVEARRAASNGDASGAVDRLTEALGLWRGSALDGVAGLTAQAARLDERRLEVTEELIDLELRLGRHASVVAHLAELVAAYPFRERLVGQLMVALYRCGRRADALEVYRSAQQKLAEELGLDPGTDLRRVELAVLRADPALDSPVTDEVGPDLEMPPTTPDARATASDRGPGASYPVPAQLPAGVRGFTGRETELAQLDRLLAASDEHPATVVISAVSGTAGVGKTSLAVTWAHRVADRFGDGQLYVNLRGFDPSAPTLSPAEALRGFLEALGVPPRQTPAGVDAQSALYRSLLAGRRVLVVLDNARDVDQVRPLLPGAPGCLALVTSRNALTGLVVVEGAHPLHLDLLTPDEAGDLLSRRLGRERVAAESDAVDEIINRCARLPLALAIVAARATTHLNVPLATLADELQNTHGQLDALTTGDTTTDVRAVFSWSYRALSPEAARLFRLLGLHPGHDISAPAAASLAGLPPPRVRPMLAELTRAHLVTNDTPGRYSLHDLLRAYAAELAYATDLDDDRHAACHRLLDHYLHTAHTADRLLNPHRPPITLSPARSGVLPEPVAGREPAEAWLTTEYPVLSAAIRWAAAAGFDTHAWQLAWAVWTFLNTRGRWQDQVVTLTAALDATRRLANWPGEIELRRYLARAYAWLGRYNEAQTQLRHALDRSEELDDHAGKTHTHVVFGFVCERQGDYREALRHAQQALELSRSPGQRIGQARALNQIGWYHAQLGEREQALTYCRQALALHGALGNHAGEAATLDSLGYAHHHLRQHREALACYQRALLLRRDLGDRYEEAGTLTHLGDTQLAAGNPDAARNSWQHALTILQQLDHPDADAVRTRLHHLDQPRSSQLPAGAHRLGTWPGRSTSRANTTR